MKTVYIKFIHPEDIYAINESYDLRPDDFVPPKVCGRCGESLYISVELPENCVIEQPMGALHRPLPREKPDLVIRGKPEPIIIEFVSNNKLSIFEQQRLKSFRRVCYVDKNGFSLLIDGFSKKPIKHLCYDLRS